MRWLLTAALSVLLCACSSSSPDPTPTAEPPTATPQPILAAATIVPPTATSTSVIVVPTAAPAPVAQQPVTVLAVPTVIPTAVSVPGCVVATLAQIDALRNLIEFRRSTGQPMDTPAVAQAASYLDKNNDGVRDDPLCQEAVAQSMALLQQITSQPSVGCVVATQAEINAIASLLAFKASTGLPSDLIVVRSAASLVDRDNDGRVDADVCRDAVVQATQMLTQPTPVPTPRR